MTVLRTRNDGCYALQQNSWGTYLAPASDPLADTVITQEQLDGFELAADIPKIPAQLWQRWLDLCFEVMKRNDSDLEVSCRFLRNVENPSQYRIVVPEQVITSVSVRVNSFDNAVDIETGEVIKQWPPEGWRPCGSSHSHNTMQAFFSGTDDEFELGDPGLHIVVGELNLKDITYTNKASVTANFRRFIIDIDDVVETNIEGVDTSLSYHPNVFNAIKLPAPFKRSDFGKPLPPLGASNTPDVLLDSNPIHFVQPEINAVYDAIQRLRSAAAAKNVRESDALEDVIAFAEDFMYFNREVSGWDDPYYYNSWSMV